MKRAEVVNLGSLSTYVLGEDSYDSTKLGLGKLMIQKSGSGEANWAGPVNTVDNPLRFGELTAFAGAYPYVIQWSNTSTNKLDWIFLFDQSTAAATRQVFLVVFNRLTGTWDYKGRITLTYPTATNHTIRTGRATYDKYSIGTVQVSGTGVTGSSTLWSTNRQCVGCRIGFGSTDPVQISTWYIISAIGSDTSITLSSSAGTIDAGTAYVIEDLRIVTVTTNATATNGGLYVAKGINYNDFVAGGTTIPAATTTDNIKAVYWLKDAATITNTTANGGGIEAKTDWQNQNFWVGNGTTTQQLFKHNLRAALSLTTGAATNQFIWSTGVSATLTGTASQASNGRIFTASSGPGSGAACYYFTTGTRIYRTKAISTITTGDTTFISSGDQMAPGWPSGTTNIMNQTAPANMQSVEYSDLLDLIIINNIGNSVNKMLLGPYRSDGSTITRIMLSQEVGNNVATSAAIAANTSVEPPVPSGGIWSEAGLLYVIVANATYGGMWALPIGCDWEYVGSTSARLISPAISLTNASKITNINVQATKVVGSNSGNNLGSSVNPFRVVYRTSGISDNTGGWTAVNQTGIVSIAGVSQIQIAIEFRSIGHLAATAKIHSIAVLYDDDSTIDNYQFSASKSDATTKKFAWRFSKAFGGTVPSLTIKLYDVTDAESPILLVTDNTASPTNGTFEKTTDGTSWGSYNTTDKANDTTYIRYTPTSIADNVIVEARLILT
jgi:hypothetical protein